MRHVAATQCHPPDLRDHLKPRIHTEVGDLVVRAVDEQRFNCNLVCVLPALPAFDRTDYDELCRPLAVDKVALNIDVYVLMDLKLDELTWSGRLWDPRSDD